MPSKQLQLALQGLGERIEVALITLLVFCLVQVVAELLHQDQMQIEKKQPILPLLVNISP